MTSMRIILKVIEAVAPPHAVQYGQIGPNTHASYVLAFVEWLSGDLDLAGSIYDMIRNGA